VLIGLVENEVSAGHRRKAQRWLEQQISMEEAEAYFQERDESNSGCPYGNSWLETFQRQIQNPAKPGDEIWKSKSDAAAWANLKGEMGIALVRGGNVIALIVTGKS